VFNKRNEDYHLLIHYVLILEVDLESEEPLTRGMYQFIGFDNNITYKKIQRSQFWSFKGIITQDYRFENQSIAATDFIRDKLEMQAQGKSIRPKWSRYPIFQSKKNIAYISRLTIAFKINIYLQPVYEEMDLVFLARLIWIFSISISWMAFVQREISFYR
jgi:hypothetical protein